MSAVVPDTAPASRAFAPSLSLSDIRTRVGALATNQSEALAWILAKEDELLSLAKVSKEHLGTFLDRLFVKLGINTDLPLSFKKFASSLMSKAYDTEGWRPNEHETAVLLYALGLSSERPTMEAADIVWLIPQLTDSKRLLLGQLRAGLDGETLLLERRKTDPGVDLSSITYAIGELMRALGIPSDLGEEEQRKIAIAVAELADVPPVHSSTSGATNATQSAVGVFGAEAPSVSELDARADALTQAKLHTLGLVERDLQLGAMHGEFLMINQEVNVEDVNYAMQQLWEALGLTKVRNRWTLAKEASIRYRERHGIATPNELGGKELDLRPTNSDDPVLVQANVRARRVGSIFRPSSFNTNGPSTPTSPEKGKETTMADGNDSKTEAGEQSPVLGSDVLDAIAARMKEKMPSDRCIQALDLLAAGFDSKAVAERLQTTSNSISAMTTTLRARYEIPKSENPKWKLAAKEEIVLMLAAWRKVRADAGASAPAAPPAPPAPAKPAASPPPTKARQKAALAPPANPEPAPKLARTETAPPPPAPQTLAPKVQSTSVAADGLIHSPFTVELVQPLFSNSPTFLADQERLVVEGYRAMAYENHVSFHPVIQGVTVLMMVKRV